MIKCLVVLRILVGDDGDKDDGGWWGVGCGRGAHWALEHREVILVKH